jgi:hypothetical protein
MATHRLEFSFLFCSHRGMPLTYRDKGTSGTQLAIYSHKLCIGHIGKQSSTLMGGQHSSWRWTFAFHGAAPKGFPGHGTAATLEKAKAIVEQSWQEWLTAAGLSEVNPAV